MGNHRVGVAICAAALIAATACASTAPSAQGALHAEGARVALADVDFSDLRIADHFKFRQAAPIAASADGDPSYALPHESLLAGKDILSLYTEDRTGRRSLMARAADNLPEGWEEVEDGALRHKPSGLRCPAVIKLPEEQREFQLLEIRGFDQKNLDVGCNYSTGSGAELILYASFWPQMSLEDSAGASVEAIMLRFPVKGRLPVAVADVTAKDGTRSDELERPEAGSFDIGEVGGVAYKTSLWIVKTEGWHVKVRATYAQQDVTSEIVSAVMFALAHIDVRAKNIEEPVAAGGEV